MYIDMKLLQGQNHQIQLHRERDDNFWCSRQDCYRADRQSQLHWGCLVRLCMAPKPKRMTDPLVIVDTQTALHYYLPYKSKNCSRDHYPNQHNCCHFVRICQAPIVAWYWVPCHGRERSALENSHVCFSISPNGDSCLVAMWVGIECNIIPVEAPLPRYSCLLPANRMRHRGDMPDPGIVRLGDRQPHTADGSQNSDSGWGSLCCVHTGWKICSDTHNALSWLSQNLPWTDRGIALLVSFRFRNTIKPRQKWFQSKYFVRHQGASASCETVAGVAM